MPRSDRLATLGACHGVLRFHRLHTIDAYRAATPEQLASLHRYRAEIRRLLAAGHPDVILASFPAAGISWSISRLTYDPHDRHLTMIKGTIGETHDTLLDVRYDVRDEDAERQAWRALVGALR